MPQDKDEKTIDFHLGWRLQKEDGRWRVTRNANPTLPVPIELSYPSENIEDLYHQISIYTGNLL